MLAAMRDLLVGIPAPELPNPDIGASVAYLASDAALASLDRDAYWPKWDSPWWHALLLFELGEARHIPDRAARALAAATDRMPLHIFAIHDHEKPPGFDPRRDMQCHCALGSLTQVLLACGVPLPAWFEPWFARYQMADGGLNCDETAYLATGECPSSMVGTIASFEAMRRLAPADPFVARAAQFLVERRLTEGSPTRHNAEERDAAPKWLLPCFPRFYFYDVLRGLSALASWARDTGSVLPRAAIAPVVEHLARTFPDGVVRIGREGFAGTGTLALRDGQWVREPVAVRFPLLDGTSAIGSASPALTRQWTATRAALLELLERDLVA